MMSGFHRDFSKNQLIRFDLIKKKVFTPITCPNCNKPMTKGQLDKYMFSIHQKCSDCVIEHETKLKFQGKYEEYEHNMIKKGVEYHIKEMEGVLLDLLMNNGEQFVTENGEIEEWKGKGLNEQFIKDILPIISVTVVLLGALIALVVKVSIIESKMDLLYDIYVKEKLRERSIPFNVIDNLGMEKRPRRFSPSETPSRL